MSYLIVILLSAAIAHLIYEYMVAPSLLMKLRFRLFALRDSLRQLKIESPGALDDRQFGLLQDSVNGLIMALPRMDAAMLATLEGELRRNWALRIRVATRARILALCTSPEGEAIRQESLRIAASALMVNSGALWVLVAPILLCAVGLRGLQRRVGALVSLSVLELERLAPRPSLEGAESSGAPGR